MFNCLMLIKQYIECWIDKIMIHNFLIIPIVIPFDNFFLNILKFEMVIILHKVLQFAYNKIYSFTQEFYSNHSLLCIQIDRSTISNAITLGNKTDLIHHRLSNILHLLMLCIIDTPRNSDNMLYIVYNWYPANKSYFIPSYPLVILYLLTLFPFAIYQ